MTATTTRKRGSREKVRTHRQRMRAREQRQIQLWVPDTRTAAFRAQAHRQALAVARSGRSRQDQDFIDAVSTA